MGRIVPIFAVWLVLVAGCASLLGADFDVRARDGAVDPNGEEAETSTADGPSSSADGEIRSTDGAASADGAAEPNAGCQGTAAGCASVGTESRCTLHGCSWATPKCIVTSPCDTIASTAQCGKTPGCAIDVTVPGGTNPCQPEPGYCSGTTKTACQIKAACKFTGGCGGTPTRCADIASQASCNSRDGCSWH